MARVRTRFPSVFVGHPFSNRFPVKKFRGIFQDLPFKVIYGNTDLQTSHLLTVMKSNILKADYSIFDLSDWNPNVALELGLAEGLRKLALKKYYILLNTRRSKEVPSDIRGIQRLEYTAYDYSRDVGLADQLVRFILTKEYWIKKIWKKLPDTEKGWKKRLMLLHILAFMRDHEKLTPDNIRSISQGSRLRENDRNEVLQVSVDLGLLKTLKGSDTYVVGRLLFAKA